MTLQPGHQELIAETARLQATLQAIAGWQDGGQAPLPLRQALQGHVRSLRLFLDLDSAAVLHDLAEAAARMLDPSRTALDEAAFLRQRTLLDAVLRRRAARVGGEGPGLAPAGSAA